MKIIQQRSGMGSDTCLRGVVAALFATAAMLNAATLTAQSAPLCNGKEATIKYPAQIAGSRSTVIESQLAIDDLQRAVDVTPTTAIDLMREGSPINPCCCSSSLAP